MKLATALLLVGSIILEPLTAAPQTTTTLRLVYFHSKVFGNNRMLRVLLPPGYDSVAQRGVRYPVLYLNDGQDLFDPRLSTYHSGSQLLQDKMDALYARGAVRRIIIVGMDNAGGHRNRRPNEYLPWPDNTLHRPSLPHPQGKSYPQFVVGEVMPYIQSHFRVTADPEETGIGGASYGALAAIYAVAKAPGRFGRLLIESPSVYSDDYHLIKVVAGMMVVPKRIAIGVGTDEDGDPSCDQHHPPEPEMIDVTILRAALDGVSHGRSTMLLTVAPCAKHVPPAFGARFPAAVSFLFGHS